MINKETFLIGDLARMADVTVRTIRYYLDQGLLMEPDKQGKYAYFSDEHLERLELIKKLKDLRLPLDEIKLILQRADEEEIQKLLNIQEKAKPEQVRSADKAEIKQPGKAALNYIAQIASARSVVEQADEPKFSPPVTRENTRRNLEKSDDIKEERWIRIQLGEGVELNYRVSLDPKEQYNIDQLIQFARNLFGRTRGRQK